MGRNNKKSVERAMLNHHKRQLPKRESRKKNRQVEKEEVEKPCILWMKHMGFEVEISKAEAKWNPSANRFTRTALKSGMTDTRGWDSKDRPFYVEFKAPGRLRDIYGSAKKGNLNRQSNFIKKQISRNCFAVVVDDVDLLKKLWRNWTIHMDNGDDDAARKYLYDALPPEPNRRKKESNLF